VLRSWAYEVGGGGIFIHNTDKVEEGIMVLLFGLVFFRCPLLRKFSANVLGCFMDFTSNLYFKIEGSIL